MSVCAIIFRKYNQANILLHASTTYRIRSLLRRGHTVIPIVARVKYGELEG